MPEMPCRFCGIVNTICYGGPRPVKSWKRPVLLVVSLPILAGGGAFGWVMFFSKASIVGAVLGLFVLAMGACGIVISILGCDNCVARFFGEF
jgi:hypothetical protein